MASVLVLVGISVFFLFVSKADTNLNARVVQFCGAIEEAINEVSNGEKIYFGAEFRYIKYPGVSVKKSAILRVPQDYPIIQDAVEAADAGDIIYISSGEYCQSIKVNKASLKIVGENNSDTVIDLEGLNFIEITADNVMLSGFTVQNAGHPYYAVYIRSNGNIICDNIFQFNYGGIYCGLFMGRSVKNNLILNNEVRNSTRYALFLSNAKDNIITRNTFSGNDWGITLYRHSTNNVISGNIISDTRNLCVNLNNSTHNIVSSNNVDFGEVGIYVDFYSNSNVISKNNVTNINGSWAIHVFNSFHNVIDNNNVFNNSGGIYLNLAANATVKNNVMKENHYNFGVKGREIFHFVHDIDDSNKINGKSIFYLLNQEQITVNPYTFHDVGFLGIVNSTNVSVDGLSLVANLQGILLAHTTESTVENVTVSKNHIGIDLFNSSNNYVVGNTISDNSYGVFLANSTGSIYKNNFVGNVYQAYCSMSNSSWDNGAEGNYWSDYNGEDLNGDGIGDFPYVIDENNRDNFPLVSPVCSTRVFDAGTWDQITYYVAVSSNSTIACFGFDQAAKQICFNVTGPLGTTGFCNVTVPKCLLDGPYDVQINDSPAVFLMTSNGTHNFLYIAYEHTTHNMRVIGTKVISEFVLALIFPFFLLLTLTICILSILKRHNH